MDRTKAMAALDDAFSERMRFLFGVLHVGVDDGQSPVRFARGLADCAKAYAIAAEQIGKTFGA